jgi:glycosyltransferase involved in cell wall biosynthesis
MFTAFLRWKQSCSLPHKLVLIGKPVMPVPSHPDIRCVGFVPESEKWDAMAACDWLIQPSPYESLSLVLLETWAMGRPALVNAKCAVLAEHCSESRGGLAFSNWDEAMVAVELTDAGQKAALGTNGRNYVAERYTWRHVCDAYRAEIVLPRNSAEP